MDDYAKYEAESKKMRAENKVLLTEFANYLKDKGLTENTIYNHTSNVEFFINDFLLYSDIIPPEDGIEEVDSFLGDWFIRKATWSSPGHIKSSAASFKKFYGFLVEKGMVSKEELKYLKETIKEELADWMAAADRW